MTSPRNAIARLCLLAALARSGSTGAVETVRTEEHIDFDRPEAWGMKYFASVTLMTGMGTPRPLRPGQLRIGLEGDWVPDLSRQQRTVGFNGTKVEDLNKLPVFGRLRVTVGLFWTLSLTLSYLPPIPIHGLQANLFSLSLGLPIRLRPHLVIGLSTYGQVGSIKGAFTCPRSAVRAGANLDENPFGCLEESHDQVDLNYIGVEISGSYQIPVLHGLEPYVSAGSTYLNLRFRVHARYGEVDDRTQLATQGVSFHTTFGLLFPVTRRLDLVSEVFYSPLAVQRPPSTTTTVDGLFNVRAMIAYRFL